MTKHLCLLGLMTSHTRNGDGYRGQCLTLKHLFEKDGYELTCASTQLNPFLRLLEMMGAIVKSVGRAKVVVLDIYGGRSFYIEDVVSLWGTIWRRKMIFVFRGGDLPEFFKRHPGWARRVLRRAFLRVTPSAYLQDSLKELGFETVVVPNTIDLSQFDYRQRVSARPRMLWMRTFHPVYNPEMAVEVLAKVRKKFPEATLTMAGGDRNYIQNVKELARRLKVEEGMRFVGFLDAEGKRREMNEADIFLNTNRIDNMPVSVVEACASGMAVVATSVGGVPYLLQDQSNGMLVPNENSDAMASAVIQLLETPKLAAHVSSGAKTVADCSSWSEVRKKSNALLEMGENREAI